jgi:hypothetical protein
MMVRRLQTVFYLYTGLLAGEQQKVQVGPLLATGPRRYLPILRGTQRYGRLHIICLSLLCLVSTGGIKIIGLFLFRSLFDPCKLLYALKSRMHVAHVGRQIDKLKE